MPNKERVVPEKYQGRKIYSISRLQSFNTCKYGYYKTYILKEKGRQNIYAQLGTIVHECLENLQNRKMTREQALQKFDVELLKCDVLDMSFPSEKIKNNFINCLKHYLANYEPYKCKNFTLEKEFYTEIEKNVIMGFIDVAIENEDDTVTVYDYKTSTKFTNQNLDEHGMQLVLYAIALEQVYGVKINSAKWNMLKYCIIKWKGASTNRERFCLRNAWVDAMKNELSKDLKKSGFSESEVEIMMTIAIANNSILNLPKEIQEKYKMYDGEVEYPLTKENRKKLISFVCDTITEIEKMPKDNEKTWTPCDIEKNNFFCGTLCNHGNTCKFYKEFIQNNSFKFKKDEVKTTSDKILSEIFS